MWTLIWRIVCSSLNDFTIHHADAQWNDFVEQTDSVDNYEAIVQAMLCDGIINLR